MTGSTEGIGKRLREALAPLDDGTIKWLQAEMEKADVPGSKYSNVQRYVAGTAQKRPPLEWLEGAAKVLDVRPAWLVFDDGPMREGALFDDDAGEEGRPLTVFERLAEERDVPVGPGAHMLGGAAGKAVMRELIGRLIDAQPADAPDPSQTELRHLAYSLDFSFSALWGALSERQVPMSRMRSMYLAWISALLTMVAPPGAGKNRIAEVSARIPIVPGPQPSTPKEPETS